MKRKLYGDPRLAEELVSRITPSDKLSDVYVDSSTNESWFKYEVRSMYIGEPRINLVCFPEPTTTEIIDIALSSEHHDEVVAASLRLRDHELHIGTEFREELLNRLTGINIKRLTSAEKARLITIISLTELTHGENRREVVGKNSAQVSADFDFFMRIADRADRILEALQ